MSRVEDKKGGALRLKVCWAIAIAWFVLTMATVTWPSIAAATPGVPLPGVLLLIFVLVYGSLAYGWKGIGLYFVIGVIVGLVFEATSIAAGFPFGYYVHNVPGPRLLEVPIPTIFAYAVLGVPAWSLARLIVRADPNIASGADRWTTPIIAAFIMTGVDLAFDPIGATVLGQWTYRHPSGQFGVPLSNFLGWVLTGWVIFQVFALVEHRFTGMRVVKERSYWWLICLVWLGHAAQYPVLFLHAPPGTAAVGARTFVIADVFEAALIVSLFAIVFSALLGFCRLIAQGR